MFCCIRSSFQFINVYLILEIRALALPLINNFGNKRLVLRYWIPKSHWAIGKVKFMITTHHISSLLNFSKYSDDVLWKDFMITMQRNDAAIPLRKKHDGIPTTKISLLRLFKTTTHKMMRLVRLIMILKTTPMYVQI